MKSPIAIAVLLLSFSGCPKKVPTEEPVPLSLTAPQITRFIARPEVVHAGEESVLVWNARNVQQVLLEQAAEPHDEAPGEFLHPVGEFPANGTLALRPKWTTTYVISCGNENAGTASASATVVVR